MSDHRGLGPGTSSQSGEAMTKVKQLDKSMCDKGVPVSQSLFSEITRPTFQIPQPGLLWAVTDSQLHGLSVISVGFIHVGCPESPCPESPWGGVGIGKPLMKGCRLMKGQAGSMGHLATCPFQYDTGLVIPKFIPIVPVVVQVCGSRLLT